MFLAILSPRNQTERTVSPPTSRSNVPAKAVCLQPKLSPAILCRRNQTARPLSPPPSPSNIAAEPVSLNLSLYLHLRLFLTFRSTFMQPLINSTNGTRKLDHGVYCKWWVSPAISKAMDG